MTYAQLAALLAADDRWHGRQASGAGADDAIGTIADLQRFAAMQRGGGG